MKIKCKCKDEKIIYIFCFDDLNEGIAFNVYGCDNCGMIIKEDVWTKSTKPIVTYLEPTKK